MDFSKIKYSVIDTETTVKCPPEVSNNKALPMWKDNGSVLFGVKGNGLRAATCQLKALGKDTDTQARILVGQNIPFDLQYIKKENPEVYKDLVEHYKVWDTALAEYLISAQTKLYPSLDYLTNKYGGKLKDDKIKAYWDAGVQTEDIPKGELEEYLLNDLDNTENAFKKQMEDTATRDRDLCRFILSQGNTAFAIADIMANGMKVDVEELKRQVDKATLDVSAKTAILESHCQHWLRGSDARLAPFIDIGSNVFIGKFLFGGTFKVKEKQPDGFYKNGKPKLKTVEVGITHIPDREYKNTEQYKVANKTGWSVDDDVLTSIRDGALGTPSAFCRVLLELRKLNKDLSTYLEPLLATAELTEGLIYGNINNTATATGRFSSSNPNFQNFTGTEKSDLKKAFVSRWGKDGVIVEADYKQLEIVALAYITDCKQLKEDINNGLDIHNELYISLYKGGSLPEKERKWFKRRSFALIYGASAKGIAEQAKCSLEDAKKFVKVFRERYPEVFQFRTKLSLDLISKAEPDGFDEETKLPKRKAVWKAKTGRLLTFKQYYSDYLKSMQFSSTQVANYPIQSFATGDVMEAVLGVLFRKIFLTDSLREKCLIINTVHDSIVFDIHISVLEEALNLIVSCMSNVSGILNSLYGLNDFDVEVIVNVTKGSNWWDQEKVDTSPYL